MNSRAIQFALAFVFCPTLATPLSAEELFSYFQDSERPLGASITISPCRSDEVAECEAHILRCDKEWEQVEFDIIVGNIEAVAAGLIVGTQGMAEGMLRLSGTTSVAVEITRIEVVANELDGGWMLSLGFANSHEVLAAIRDPDGEGADIELAGEHFSLAPQPGDGAKLARLATACLGR